MNVELYKVEARPGDVLYVRGAVDGVQAEAFGWQSAITNHFDASAYGEDGHRDPKAQPREMSADEARVYCEQLLIDALGYTSQVVAPPAALPAIALDPEPEPPAPAEEEPTP